MLGPLGHPVKGSESGLGIIGMGLPWRPRLDGGGWGP